MFCFPVGEIWGWLTHSVKGVKNFPTVSPSEQPSMLQVNNTEPSDTQRRWFRRATRGEYGGGGCFLIGGSATRKPHHATVSTRVKFLGGWGADIFHPLLSEHTLVAYGRGCAGGNKGGNFTPTKPPTKPPTSGNCLRFVQFVPVNAHVDGSTFHGPTFHSLGSLGSPTRAHVWSVPPVDDGTPQRRFIVGKISTFTGGSFHSFHISKTRTRMAFSHFPTQFAGCFSHFPTFRTIRTPRFPQQFRLKSRGGVDVFS